MSKRVLLTGASGFIGSHACEHLMQKTDWELVCPVTFRHKGDALRLDTNSFDPKRIQVIYHDLAGPFSDIQVSKIGNIDYIWNFAADSHVDRSIEDPRPFIENNVASVLTMLELARVLKPEIFFQVSTDEVYGPAPEGIDHPEWSAILPSNPYSGSKACQEAIAISYWRTFGIRLVITNTMNNIGERQDAEKWVPKVISYVNRGDVLPVHIDPETGKPGSRFYLHARNHADALLYLTKIEPGMFPESQRPHRYNVVGDREIDNLEMAQIIADMLGKPLKYELVDAHSSRPGHDPRYALDGSLLHSLGWRPPVNIEAALAKTVEWSMTHKEWLVTA